MAPEMEAGKVIGWACSMELFDPVSAISGRWPTLMGSGSETPLAATTRNSRAPSFASAAALSLTTRRLLSLAGAASERVIVPAADSIEMAGCGAAGGGTFVALSPASPLKIKPETEPRLSPTMVSSLVVPRWIHSGEMEVILGTGWAEATE